MGISAFCLNVFKRFSLITCNFLVKRAAAEMICGGNSNSENTVGIMKNQVLLCCWVTHSISVIWEEKPAEPGNSLCLSVRLSAGKQTFSEEQWGSRERSKEQCTKAGFGMTSGQGCYRALSSSAVQQDTCVAVGTVSRARWRPPVQGSS